MPGEKEGKWHSVVDKNSGRTYYYNDLTKKTTWDKPRQLMSEEEAALAAKQEQERKDFFAEMERNILLKLSGAAEQSSSSSSSRNRDLMEEQMEWDQFKRERDNSADASAAPVVHRQRTISTIDSEMMLFLKTHAREAGALDAQAKDDSANRGSFACAPRVGQWSSVAAGLLDPGSEAKHASSIRMLDEKWGSTSRDSGSGSGGSLGYGVGSSRSGSHDFGSSGGVSILGTSPANHATLGGNTMAADFDFLKEMDYLKAGFKSKATVSASSAATATAGASSRNNAASPRTVAAQNAAAKPGIRRRNSTSTIFVCSTMEKQDNEATIKCVAVVIRAHMRSATKLMGLPSHKYDVFLDAAYRDEFEDSPALSHKAESKLASSPEDGLAFHGGMQQSKEVFSSGQGQGQGQSSPVPRGGRMRSGSNSGRRTMQIPSLEEIESFLLDIFSKSQLEGECIIMSLIYCERLVKQTKGKLSIRYDNWRSITFACLVMASKVWDDLSMWNADFSNVCSSFDLQRVNELEMAMLDIMSYCIKVSASEYAKYYFHLRSMMTRLGINKSGLNQPLDLIGARKLQLASEHLQQSTGNGKGGAGGGGGGVGAAGGGVAADKAGGAAFHGRSRGITTTGIAPGSLDRVTMHRTASTDTGSTIATGTLARSNLFLGVDELMHSSHTKADGSTATLSKPASTPAAAASRQRGADAK